VKMAGMETVESLKNICLLRKKYIMAAAVAAAQPGAQLFSWRGWRGWRRGRQGGNIYFFAVLKPYLSIRILKNILTA